VDESTMRARDVLRCRRCGAVARPNILMFGDFAWVPTRMEDQQARFDAFLAAHRDRRIVVIELGAGTAIPSVRLRSERIAQLPAATLVRVNPRDPEARDGAISISAGALPALEAIESRLAASGAGRIAMTRETRRDQMHEGPWLDRLFPILLPGGRMVSVTAFSVLPSNVGILEGGLEPRANASQRDKIVKLAESRYGAPVVLVEPAIVPLSAVARPGRPRERLPWMACMARLSSAPLDPDLVSSELTLVWWQDGFTSPMPAEIERAAAGVEWERVAIDVDLP
jgi:hypothetical protein